MLGSPSLLTQSPRQGRYYFESAVNRTAHHNSLLHYATHVVPDYYLAVALYCTLCSTTQAYADVVARYCGEDVPLKFLEPKGFFTKLFS
jgi:hypothetical protein